MQRLSVVAPTQRGGFAAPQRVTTRTLNRPALRLPHVNKAAISMDVPGATIPTLSDAERAALAERLGYTKIGKPLPSNVTLTDIIKSMPAEVFDLDHGKAWSAVLISLVSFGACLALIAASPWYLLPFAWALAGTAFTGWFVVGHDAGHRSFHRNKLVEDIVGTIMFMPLIYPFEPWRIKHNHHHAHTNKLVEDTAWHPVMPNELAKWSKGQRQAFEFFLGSPLKLFASIGHWWIWHFDLSLYTEKQKPRVIVSLAAVFLFMAVGWPAIIYNFGIAGWVKFWLMPWIGYHFWMSTFTVIHHTAPHIPFKPDGEWNPAQAQLGGTVHCNFPRWVEVLCHDISVHVPHHVNSKIPWYNLRKATDSLRKNWGEYMTEANFNWTMLKTIFTELHVYDKEKNYVPFDFAEQEETPLLAIQRRVL